MFTDRNGMTLYVSNSIPAEGATVNLDSIEMWIPYLSSDDDALAEGWTRLKRSDGRMQLAYLGNPTYLFHGDRTKGDMRGAGLDGRWHVLQG
jgi:predicted lipoprotein with Yx(FWY)xxD motif